MKYTFLFLTALFMIWSCKDHKHPKTAEAQREVLNRKIKRISAFDILNQAEKQANDIFTALKTNSVEDLNQNLLKLDIGNLKDYALYDNSTKDSLIINTQQAYRYAIENKQTLERNLQETEKDYYFTEVNDSTLYILTLSKKRLIQLLGTH